MVFCKTRPPELCPKDMIRTQYKQNKENMEALLKELMIDPLVDIVMDYTSPDYRGQYNRCMMNINRYGINLQHDLKSTGNVDIDERIQYWWNDIGWGDIYDDVGCNQMRYLTGGEMLTTML